MTTPEPRYFCIIESMMLIVAALAGASFLAAVLAWSAILAAVALIAGIVGALMWFGLLADQIRRHP